ncbi:hypothetical protein BHE74_00026465 [Ensete ventricosum]|nr:hypothetical protein BHE74_00026465 [Ensete ventricosum]
MGVVYQSDRVQRRGGASSSRAGTRARCCLVFPHGDEGAASSSRARTRQPLAFQRGDKATPPAQGRGVA